MRRSVIDCAGEIAAEFGLGGVVAVAGLPGGANILWRIETERGTFVAKELPAEHASAYARAAELEHRMFLDRVIAMPEPCLSRSGSLVLPTQGTDGRDVVVRVQRYVRGKSVVPTPDVLRQAGRTLARMHRYGTDIALRMPLKSFWTAPDRQLSAAWRWARPVLDQAAEFTRRRPHRDLIPAHCDFKPANCLVAGDRLLVLDWDEAGGCDPRLDAVDAALAWARPSSAEPAIEDFVTFAESYDAAFPPVEPDDFAKSVANQASWFEHMVGRSDRAAAEAIDGLQYMLSRLPGWCSSIKHRRAAGPQPH